MLVPHPEHIWHSSEDTEREPILLKLYPFWESNVAMEDPPYSFVFLMRTLNGGFSNPDAPCMEYVPTFGLFLG